MVIVGTDVHKRTHTFVAVDEVADNSATKSSPPPPPAISKL